MTSFAIGKIITGILMAVGSCIPLLMISDLLYRIIIFLFDLIDARIHGRNNVDAVKSMVLSAGIGRGDFDGLNGVLLPSIIGVFAAGFTFYTLGLDKSALLILLILLWTITWACQSNCFYHKSYYLHSVILAKRFFASFVTSNTTDDAMINAYGSLPAGTIKSYAKECVRMSNRHVPWEKAVRVFNNGTFCGQILSSYLNIFENSNTIVTDEITASFTKELTEKAETIMEQQNKTKTTNLVVLAASAAYSIAAGWFIYNGHTTGAHMIVLYCAGVILSAARLLLRNVVVKGRLV